MNFKSFFVIVGFIISLSFLANSQDNKLFLPQESKIEDKKESKWGQIKKWGKWTAYHFFGGGYLLATGAQHLYPVIYPEKSITKLKFENSVPDEIQNMIFDMIHKTSLDPSKIKILGWPSNMPISMIAAALGTSTILVDSNFFNILSHDSMKGLIGHELIHLQDKHNLYIGLGLIGIPFLVHFGLTYSTTPENPMPF